MAEQLEKPFMFCNVKKDKITLEGSMADKTIVTPIKNNDSRWIANLATEKSLNKF